jgi:hypothetical protein
MPLFLDLLDNGIIATSTLRAIRKYALHAMFWEKITSKQNMGWIDCCMHVEKIVWCGKTNKQ